jgi:hypothetical protein
MPRVDHAAAALIEMRNTQPAMLPPSSLPAPSPAAQVAKPSYPLVPDDRAVPEFIIPAINTQRPERISQPSVYDAVTRQWNIPESSARKRSMGPRIDEVQNRQRPRLATNLSSKMPAPAMPKIPSIASVINSDGMDAAEDDDSEDSELLSFEYKRADGTMSHKPVEQMRKRYSTPAW